MAKNWYPEINELTCTECGACIAKCTHGVYDKNIVLVPNVINPDNCIDHCHGCGNICPTGAITYVGDDTGWIAPALNGQEAGGDCGCSCAANRNEKVVKIEYLFLDLNTCDRCIGTDGVLDEVVNVLGPVLELAGYKVFYQKQEISNAQLAKKYHFLSSPTILVNGQDIFGTISESDCGCCGDIAGVQVDCRVFEYNGNKYEVPTKEMIIDAILRRLYNPAITCCNDYQLPENLKRFFEGKENKLISCCCCESC